MLMRYPSGGDLATVFQAATPVVAEFSTTTACPSRSASRSASSRLTKSGLPPAGLPITIRIVRAGHCWAASGEASMAESAAARRRGSSRITRAMAVRGGSRRGPIRRRASPPVGPRQSAVLRHRSAHRRSPQAPARSGPNGVFLAGAAWVSARGGRRLSPGVAGRTDALTAPQGCRGRPCGEGSAALVGRVFGGLLVGLGLVPEVVHLCKGGLLRGLAPLRQCPFDGGEAALEFPVGGPQRRLRVGVEMTGEVDHGEQEIADLRRRIGAVAGRQFRLDLVRLLTDLGKHRTRAVPVGTGLAGLGLQLERTGQGRERHRDAGEGACLARRVRFLAGSLAAIRLLGFLLGLDTLPKAFDRFRRETARSEERRVGKECRSWRWTSV